MQSARAWFLHKFPETASRIMQNGDWAKFPGCSARDCGLDPGEFERAMQRVLQEYERDT